MCADKTPEETPGEMNKEEAANEPAEADAAAEAVPAAEEPKADKKAKKEKPPKEDKPKKKHGWIKWVALVIFVFIIMFIPFWYTRNSAACGQCHSMDKYYSSYLKSWHGKNETPCMDCHVKPGVIGENLYRFLFYRELFAEILGMDLKPWGATAPGEASCARDGCHSLNRLSSSAGDIKINHAEHIKVVEKKYNKACSYCHAGASHAGIKGLGLQVPPRQQCFMSGCHKGQGKQCDKCHTIKYKAGSVTKIPHE
ncbi:MAG: NapC/NirT family cytochrome c [Actinomycetota bacterium]